MSDEAIGTATQAGAAPRRIGPYDVVRELGRGASGVVYLARTEDGGLVAVKRLAGSAPPHAEAAALLERQTALLARLNHPHLVHTLEVEVAGPDLLLTMEYVPGPSLRRVLATRRPEARVVADWIEQLAEALDYLHALGIVHRDVKPSNVLVPEDRLVKLIDYGLAHVATDEREAEPRGLLLSLPQGSPAYMAPELARGDRIVDGRADIYSLAVVAYEALVGMPPFPAQPDDVDATLRAQIRQPPPDPTGVVPGFPAGIAEALLRGLAKDPDARPGTAREFARRLESSIEGRPLPPPPPSRARPRLGGKDDPDLTRDAPLPTPPAPGPMPPTDPPPPSIERRSPLTIVIALTVVVLGLALAGLGVAASVYHWPVPGLPAH
jgi:serine/threonine protein kinase